MGVPGYYTTREVMAKFNWSQTQVSATAHREQWRITQVGSSYLYEAADVDAYARDRLRTELSRQVGIGTQRLVRSAEFDMQCPVCGGFAYRNPTSGQWICENGHGGGADGKGSGFQTTPQLMERFGWSRQQAVVTARREKWRVVIAGNSNLYRAEDVDAYAKARLRTELARSLGYTARHLLRSVGSDMKCPVCGGFAVRHHIGWACENGHQG